MMLLAAALGLIQDFEVTPERLDALVKEVRPLVERSTGHAFKEEPKLVISEADEVRKILVTELTPQMKLQLPDGSADDHRKAAGEMAEQFTKILLGKYAAATNSIHVIPGNFKRLAERYKRPRINSADYLRVIAIHELVHAIDEQAYRAMSRIADVKSAEELVVWNAVIEGHAQHVTRAILVAEKRGDLFRDFEEQISAMPPGTSEGEKALASQQAMYVKFGYIDGRAFFEGLAATGRKTYVEDVFAKPPATKDVILHPARYYDPKARPAARDLKPLWDALRKDFDGWSTDTPSIGEFELRSAIGDFVERKALDAAMARLVGGGALSATPKDAPGSKMVVVLVSQSESGEAASALHDLFEATLKSKDERMKEGAIRITKAEYGTLKTKGGWRTTLARKTIVAAGQEVPVVDALVTVGDFTVEVLYSNEGIADDEMSKRVQSIAEWLERK